MLLSESYRHILGLNAPPPETDGVVVEVYESLVVAAPFLLDLASRTEPWTFDIETYDAEHFPSRRDVAVNPYHQDFRVRGVAVALSRGRGAWVEFGKIRLNDVRYSAGIRALIDAFASDAEKGAFNGGFDESGLVYSGWVSEVRNRTRDAMLAAVAIGDGTHGEHGLRLETLTRRLLGRVPHWSVDKSMMRELPVETVAHGAVRDACRTHELLDLLDARAAAGKYLQWSKMT